MDTLSKIIFLLGRVKFKQLMLLLFLMAISIILETASLLMIFPLMRLVNHEDYVESQPAIGAIYNFFDFSSYTSFLIAACIILTILLTLINIYRIWIHKKRVKFLSEEQMRLSSYLLSCYLGQPYPYWQNKNKAELIKNMSSDIEIIYNKILDKGLIFCTDFLLVFFILAILFFINPVMTVIILLVGCVFGLFFLFFQLKTRNLFETQRKLRFDMQNSVKQIAQAGTEIKSIGKESYFANAYAENTRNYLANTNAYKLFLQIPTIFNQTLRIYGILAVLLFTLVTNYDIRALLPLLILYGIGLLRVIPSVNRLLKSYFVIKMFKPSLNVIYDELKQLEVSRFGRSYRTRRQLLGLSETVAPKDKFIFDGHFHTITVRKVHHTVKGPKPVILKNIFMAIPFGSKVAITGVPDSEKSMVGEIIAGLTQPEGGRVLVDNIDIEYIKNGWRNNVAYVPKSIVILNDSILRNVAFGINNKDINEFRIWRALELAGLEAFVKELPKRLDTAIGRNTIVFDDNEPFADESEDVRVKEDLNSFIELNAVQIKQIGLARALYHNPKILILDETTASFDDDTERNLLMSIHDKTIIMIAKKHRTINQCDYVYEIINGQAVLKENVKNPIR